MAGSSTSFKAVVAHQASPAWFKSLDFCAEQSERIADAFAACPGADVRRAANVDRQTLLRRIRTAADDCGDSDLLIVFIAGHGALTTNNEWRFVVGETKPDELLSTGVSLNELLVEASGTKALGVLFLVDTCFSGRAIFDSAVWEQIKTRVLGLIAATSPDAESWESGALKGTAFGAALIESLASGVQANTSDQTVTLTQLGEFLGGRVSALSQLHTARTEVHLLVLRSPATTTVWLTPNADPHTAHGRIQFTRRDVTVYVRRALGIVGISAASALAVLGGFARIHQTATIKGEITQVRPGVTGLGWYQGSVIRSYSNFQGPPESANWLLREPIGRALPQRFSVQTPLGWLAGQSRTWGQLESAELLAALPTSTGIDPETSALLAQVDPKTLEALIETPNSQWGASVLQALALVSMPSFEEHAPSAVNAGIDWMQAMDSVHPPCTPALNQFLRSQKQAMPFAASVADAGAYLAGCHRSVPDLLTPITPRVDITARLAMLFRSDPTEIENLRDVLLGTLSSNASASDSLQEILALQYLGIGCAPSVVALAKDTHDSEILTGLMPILMHCPSATVTASTDRLYFQVPAVSNSDIVLSPSTGNYAVYRLWIRLSDSIMAHDSATTEARALASAVISDAARRDDAIGSVAVWPALDGKLPFNSTKERGSSPLYQGHERAFWFACAPRLLGAESVRAVDFADWKALAVATVACDARDISNEVAALNLWTKGFIGAGLGTPQDTMLHLNAVSPAERAGAAQAIVARADLDSILPAIAALQVEWLPNPEAALVPSLAAWRARFEETLNGLDHAECTEVASMLGGMRGWDARSTIGLAQPGVEAWLLAAALGEGPCDTAK